MTTVRIGQVVALPEGLARVKLISQDLAYGIPGAELGACIYFDMADGSEIVLDRSRFKDIRPVQAVYGKDGKIIGYTVNGEIVVSMPFNTLPERTEKE